MGFTITAAGNNSARVRDKYSLKGNKRQSHTQTDPLNTGDASSKCLHPDCFSPQKLLNSKTNYSPYFIK